MEDNPELYAEFEPTFDIDDLVSIAADSDFNFATTNDNLINVTASDLSLQGEEENITMYLESVDGSTPQKIEYEGQLGTGSYISVESTTILVLDTGGTLFTIQALLNSESLHKSDIDLLLEYTKLNP